jgi:DNA-binding LacI/PurR family transcriptional regulator
MRPTVKDVASRAGVSPKTVSNVMNGIVFVASPTRERVEAAIADLGYVPNLSARGLRNGRSGVIALAMPHLSTPYSAEMSHHFVEVAHQQGWGVQFEETAAEPSRAWELVSRARAHLVDGLILNPITSEESRQLALTDLPPTIIIGEVTQDFTDQVSVNSVVAAREMTEHLISLGHRQIVAVGCPGPGFQTATALVRHEGYRSGLVNAGIDPDPTLELICGDWMPRDAAVAVSSYLAAHGVPDAFFCFTDSMAIGALNALWSAGLHAPEDTAVAGFDDIADGQFATPPLTTVSFDKRAFAERTLELLGRRIADPGAERIIATMPHELIVRASTRGTH